MPAAGACIVELDQQMHEAVAMLGVGAMVGLQSCKHHECWPSHVHGCQVHRPSIRWSLEGTKMVVAGMAESGCDGVRGDEGSI